MSLPHEIRTERVVVSLRPGAAYAAALEAAVRVAQAFESELDALFVEDERLKSLAELPFAREVSRLGLGQRPMTPVQLSTEMKAFHAALRSRMERLASEAQIVVRFGAGGGGVEAMLASPAPGPRFIALAEPLTELAEPFGGFGAPSLTRLLTAPPETGCALSGIVVAGLMAQRGLARQRRGAVLAVVESAEEAAAVLEAARKLAAAGPAALVAVPFAAAESLVGRIEAEAAALKQAEIDVVIERGEVSDAAALSAVARRRRCGFLVAGLGGRLAGGEAEIRRLTAMIECPALLIGGAGRRKAARESTYANG
jgi:hypothetical protein